MLLLLLFNNSNSNSNKEGFITCYWHENQKDENEIKELTKATIRCYPIDINDTKKSINQKNERVIMMPLMKVIIIIIIQVKVIVIA